MLSRALDALSIAWPPFERLHFRKFHIFSSKNRNFCWNADTFDIFKCFRTNCEEAESRIPSLSTYSKQTGSSQMSHDGTNDLSQ